MYAPRWAKAAVIYFVVGVGFGIYMSMTENHQFPSLHAHINLLGWASMALIAAFHRAFPALEEHQLAHVNFWLYQIAFPVMMLGLFLVGVERGDVGGPLVGFGGMLIGLAVLLFALSVIGALQGNENVRRHAAIPRARIR